MTLLPTGLALDAELIDLWARRDTLTTAEWERLYHLVGSVLIKFHPSELGSLREERNVYIQDFFADKVLKVSASPSRLYHAGALLSFYRHYLIDKIRDSDRRKQYFVQASSSGPDEGEGDWLDNLPSESSEIATNNSDFTELLENGITIEEAFQSAHSFLLSCEAWIPVYLAFHFCPDKPRSEALKSLANRLNISSYHYKASQLGINWEPEKASSKGKTFADTVIGGWICQGLNIAIHPDNADAILEAFKILCFEALNWREIQEQEAAQ